MSVQDDSSSVSTTERRRYPRTKLAEIVYVDMGPDNGGVALDISEGGLAFRAAVPLLAVGEVKFSLTVKDLGKIKGTGEVAWIDEDGTRGGLKFVSLPRDASLRIRNWVQQFQTKAPTAVPLQPGLPEPVRPSIQPASEPGERFTGAPSMDVSAEKQNGGDSNAPEGLNAIFESRAKFESALPTLGRSTRGPFDPLTADDLAAADASSGSSVRRFFRGLFLSVVVAGLVAGAYLYGRRDGEARAHAAAVEQAATVPAATQAQSAAAASANATPSVPTAGSPTAGSPVGPQSTSSTPGVPVEVSGPTKTGSGQTVQAGPSNNPGESSANSEVSAEKSPVQPPVDSAPSAKPKAPESAASTVVGAAPDKGQSQLAAAQAYLNAPADKRSPTAASRLLWSAVANGNTSAAVLLADLYVRGEGVERNCDQARILLLVASERGNADAKQRLRQLYATGCR